MSTKGDLITQYLLGVLSEPQRVALETECFADKEMFEQVAAAENDLIDDYLRGTLSPDERQQFETHFLSSPRRRQRVRAARILLRSISSTGVADERVRPRASRRYSWIAALREQKTRLGWALAVAAIVLLLVGGGWFLQETSRMRREVLQAQAEQSVQQDRGRELDQQLEAQHERFDQLSEELASLREQLAALEAKGDQRSATTNVLSFFLTAGSPRGGSDKPQKLAIPPGVQSVKLRLTLKRTDYQSHRAVVTTPEGTEIWNQKVTPAQLSSGAVVVLQIPASRFTRNDYILKILGTTASGEVENAGSYYFRVER